MYKRDVAIVLLACVALLVSLQNEGTFTFEKAWFHHTQDEMQELYAQHHELPAPVVADLNGDGHIELVVTTPDLKLQVVQPAPPGHHGEGFARAVEINSISLLFRRALVAAGHRPVALQVGYIDPLPLERVRPLRKQVIVVVTASWQVLCFDHNLVMLWEYDARVHFPHHSHIKEVAVYISPHQVHGADRGLVVVGASVMRGDVASGEGLQSVAGGGVNGTGSFFEDDDVLLSEMREDAERRRLSKGAGLAEQLSDLDKDDPLAGLPGSRHFSYVAMEGGKGAVRWQHGSGDFHKDLDELSSGLVPQHQYRLDAEKLEGRHFGEASCRDYRESVLHVLPHVWDRPADTRLMEAHFIKHRVGRGASKHELAVHGSAGRGLKQTDGAGKAHAAPSGLLAGGLFRQKVGSKAGRQAAASAGNRHVAGAHGGQAAHGRGGAHHHSLDAAAPGGGAGKRGGGGKGGKGGHDHLAADVSTKGTAAEALAGAAAAAGGGEVSHAHNVTANALVAFLEEGVEVLHLFSGRTVCKLHLPPRTLHADLNGDGVLDHISVYHGHTAQAGDGEEGDTLLPGELRSVSGRGHAVSGRCTAHVRSGIPPSETLFTVQVCHTRKFGVSASRNVFQRAAAAAQPTELATPVMLPIPDLHGYSSRRRQHGMLVFMTNKGEMTAVSSGGAHLWQEYLQVSWPPADQNPDHVVPTLAAMALYTHAVPTTVLAAGTDHAVIVSEHGHVLAELELPAAPTQPLVVSDFNGDGLNDIIVVTDKGLYGYVQVQHLAGGMSLSALLLTLLIALGLVYFTQHYDPMGNMGSGGVGAGGAMGGAGAARRSAKQLRSTDYVD